MNKNKQLVLELKIKYGDKLTNRQAMEALGLSHGRELGRILYTDKLPSLSAEAVAGAMEPRIEQRLRRRYDRDTLKLIELAFELSLSKRETKALLAMGIIEESSVQGVAEFLYHLDDIVEKLKKRKYLKLLYWEHKLSCHEISNILGITYNMAYNLIVQRSLQKKKNGIRPKGKIDYIMPIEERVKHHHQERNRAVVRCDIATLQINKRYRSINAVEQDNISRQYARRSARGMWVAVHRNGHPKGIYGTVYGRWKFFFEEEFDSKREELIEEIRKIVWTKEMSVAEVKRVFGFGEELMEEIMMRDNNSILMMRGLR